MTEPQDEQIAFLRALWADEICEGCGDNKEPGAPCDTCAEKRELLRQTFPRLHGDS